MRALEIAERVRPLGAGSAFATLDLCWRVSGPRRRTPATDDQDAHHMRTCRVDGRADPAVVPGVLPAATEKARGLVASGRVLEAEATLRRVHRRLAERGPMTARGAVAFQLGWVLRAQGRVESAARWLREGLAVAVLHEPEALGYLPACLAELAHCAALMGDVAASESILAEADAGAGPDGSLGPAARHLVPARVWTAVARGEVSAAIAVALGWADKAGSMELIADRAEALHDVVRLGIPHRVVAQLAELVERIDQPIATTYLQHARALAAGDGPALAEVARSFEALGMILLAAETAAEASWALRRRGRTGSASIWAARARALAGRCEGARTPILAELDLDVPLTRREREVATLAARGLTNRQIASLLVASVRTIDNHLHHAYEKLGIGGRNELSSLLLPQLGR